MKPTKRPKKSSKSKVPRDVTDKSESIGAPKEILCAICRDGINEQGKGGVLATTCGHLYHADCLTKWFQTHMKPSARPRKRGMERGPCPTCNADQVLSLCNKIYLQSEGGPTHQNKEATKTETIPEDAKKETAETKKKLEAARNEVDRWKKDAEDAKKKLEEVRRRQATLVERLLQNLLDDEDSSGAPGAEVDSEDEFIRNLSN